MGRLIVQLLKRSGLLAPDTNRTSCDFTDYVAGLFITQSDRPNRLQPINLGSLGPLQRSLLIADGTVTRVLEAYSRQRIESIKLDQSMCTLNAEHTFLSAPAGTPIIRRRVILRGRDTPIDYVEAESLIASHRLPRQMVDEIESGDESLGRLLHQFKIEVRRELLFFGTEEQSTVRDSKEQIKGLKLLSRTYRILSMGQPLMVIEEKFPVDGPG